MKNGIIREEDTINASIVGMTFFKINIGLGLHRLDDQTLIGGEFIIVFCFLFFCASGVKPGVELRSSLRTMSPTMWMG